MRDIKFRAFFKNEKKMYSVLALEMHDTMHDRILILEKQDEVPKNDPWIMIDENIELMQHTGLKDKNGKEIYEGDILKHTAFELSSMQKAQEEIFGENSDKEHYYEPFALIWNEKEACFYSANEWHGHIGENSKRFEVIGNIYENPELLK